MSKKAFAGVLTEAKALQASVYRSKSFLGIINRRTTACLLIEHVFGQIFGSERVSRSFREKNELFPIFLTKNIIRDF